MTAMMPEPPLPEVSPRQLIAVRAIMPLLMPRPAVDVDVGGQ